MAELKEGQDASALDAIEALALEGSNRRQLGKRAAMALGICLLVVLAAALAYYQLTRLPPLADFPVAVMLPQRDGGPVSDNAERQWQGFDLAYKDHKLYEDNERNVYYFDYTKDGPKDVPAMIDRIKSWYRDGVRIFIITMSGAASRIKQEFIDWAETLPVADRPVLVATVASAPGIAAREYGVFRHYIRSRDESDMLLTYIELQNPPEVFVIYVDDSYGQQAMQILKQRLLIADNDFLIPMKLVPEQKDYAEAVENIMSITTGGADSVVVVIGYGPMIRDMLLTLRDKKTDSGRFRGEILVVSTFTEKAWRPELASDPSFASRIHTVGPGPQDPQKEKRGVVFQFSYLTLDRALQCQHTRGVDAFTRCWVAATPSATGRDWAVVELTADGDSHVALRLLGQEQW